MIPYGRQQISDADIEAVVAVLKSDFLTTGPLVGQFEAAIANFVQQKDKQSQQSVAVNSGTAALHCAYFAAGIKPGNEVLATPLTFAATTNVALHLGATVKFVDVEPDTGNMNPEALTTLASERTAAIAAVDFAGRPANIPTLQAIASKHEAVLIEDASHSFGGSLAGQLVGTLADLTTFSFHPVKPFTTAEGGAVVSANDNFIERCRLFRNHGIERDPNRHEDKGAPWHYEVQEMGLNYRIPDVLCALGISQLSRVRSFLTKRRKVAEFYFKNLADLPGIELPPRDDEAVSGWHLFVIRTTDASRREPLFRALREAGIGVQVHYEPVHTQPLYRRLGYRPGLCPVAEDYSARCISLPIFPGINDHDLDRVVEVTRRLVEDLL
jgi:UDP-4-amino-4,6-dideoxy-N-acetyl-beta-L-altrosamine transaminase